MTVHGGALPRSLGEPQPVPSWLACSAQKASDMSQLPAGSVTCQSPRHADICAAWGDGKQVGMACSCMAAVAAGGQHAVVELR